MLRSWKVSVFIVVFATFLASSGCSQSEVRQADGVRVFKTYEKASGPCSMKYDCSVDADPWTEYLSYKERSDRQQLVVSLLGYILPRVNFVKTFVDSDRRDYRDVARRIITDAFPKHSRDYFLYLGKYFFRMRSWRQGAQHYKQFRERFHEDPAQIPWVELGDFYYEAKMSRDALYCYRFALKAGSTEQEALQSGSPIDLDREQIQQRIQEMEKKHESKETE